MEQVWGTTGVYAGKNLKKSKKVKVGQKYLCYVDELGKETVTGIVEKVYANSALVKITSRKKADIERYKFLDYKIVVSVKRMVPVK